MINDTLPFHSQKALDIFFLVCFTLNCRNKKQKNNPLLKKKKYISSKLNKSINIEKGIQELKNEINFVVSKHHKNCIT